MTLTAVERAVLRDAVDAGWGYVAADDPRMLAVYAAVETVWAARGGELVARMEALAAEADAGGDHPTAARIRAALYDEENDE